MKSVGKSSIFFELTPLTHLEMGGDFDLNLALNWGNLPRVCSFKTDGERLVVLTAYCASSKYLAVKVCFSSHIACRPEAMSRQFA
jgi:hypothetical protein